MTPARHNELLRNLTTAAAKIYAAVPATESWSITAIIGELARVGQRPQHSLVAGCLESLRKDGLIKEPQPGQFIRTPVSAVTREEPLMANSMPFTPKAPTPKPSPIERIRLLSSQLMDLAAEFDEAATEIESLATKNNADTAKLRALQSTLAELMKS